MFNEKIDLYKKRVAIFCSDLERSIVCDSRELELHYHYSGTKHLDFEEAVKGHFNKIEEGEIWSATPWDSAWFQITGAVPESWRGGEIALHLDFTGEVLLFCKEGQPIRGLSGGSVFDDDPPDRTGVNFLHSVIEKAEGGETLEFFLEASCNSLFGIHLDSKTNLPKSDPNRYGLFKGEVKRARVVLFDRELYHYYMDVTILKSIYENTPASSVQHKQIVHALNSSINLFKSCRENCAKARALLAPHINGGQAPSTLTAAAIGHSHIDVAWLWPIAETVRKVGRSFATQLYLIEKYKKEGYIFGASQPQNYQFAKERYPDVYKRIKEAVAEGRWELQGGMWVEADTNIPSGEALIRQIVHGKNFYKDEFNEEIDNLWLPDVFGYSASLPQMLIKSGITFFMTQKLSWSQFNTFPHQTFNWEGIDGSTIMTHFLPEDTYNSRLEPQTLIKAQNEFKESHLTDTFLSLYGLGDGGGGPKESIIERGLRLQKTEGVPAVRFQKAKELFDELLTKSSLFEKWRGELYLEFHRGTLTTQALVKKMNRKLEYKFRNREMLCSLADPANYPVELFDKNWKRFLTTQFHDILPGSSINEVYRDTHKEHREIDENLEALKKRVVESIFTKDENATVVINYLNVPIKTVVEVESSFLYKRGEVLLESVQIGGKSYLFLELASLEIATLKREPAATAPEQEGEGSANLVVENDLVKYQFNEKGQLTSLFDKELAYDFLDGAGNVLSLYEDKPTVHDAWDIDIYYEDVKLSEAELLSHSLRETPLLKELTLQFSIGKSLIWQTVQLRRGSKRLDFRTTVEWNEKHKMLRAGFNTSLKANRASFDIQFGRLERTTDRNTLWDAAKFEVSAHKYLDLSQHEYGLALLNDCKYGHKAYDQLIDLNLLRAPTEPDVDADEGTHDLTYSLLPHAGSLVTSEVAKEAYLLNNPPDVIEGFSFKGEFPIKVESQSVFLSCLKRAEKEPCLLFRLVEELGVNDTVKLNTGTGELVESDIMEWNRGASLGKGEIELTFKPFEIRTFKLLL